MNEIFRYKGREHKEATISKHENGTMHIFNLSLCEESVGVLYIEEMCAESYVPLFVMPRIIKKEVDPEMYSIIGASHDLYVEVGIESDGRSVVSVDVAQEKMKKSMNLSEGKDPENGDGYEISLVEKSGEYTKLEIPENNFCSGDMLKIGKEMYEVITKTENNIYIRETTKEEKENIEGTMEAKLYFGDMKEMNEEEGCEEIKDVIKCVGIIGGVQPEQYQYFCGQISIATIVRGPVEVQMTEEEAEEFRPGDIVYMHMKRITNLSEDLKIYYSVEAKLSDARFSYLMGIFITQKAHSVGMLGQICLMDHTPPIFEL